MSDTRKIKYKKVMVPMPHCPVCGTWDWNLGGLNYTIIKEHSDE